MKLRLPIRGTVAAAVAALAMISGPSLASANFQATGAARSSVKALAKHIYPTVAGAVDNRNKGYLGVGNGAGPLLWGGGAIQKAPKVYLTVWGFNGSDPSGEQARLTNFFNGVGGSSWANIQTQYHGTSA